MIFPDPKKSATMLLSKMNKDGESKEMEVAPESDLPGTDMGLKSAAEDVMQAIHDKSPHDLMVGLKSFFDMCDSDTEEEDDEEGFQS